MLKEKREPALRPRDVLVLTWIAQQYAIRLDQLQWLLGQMPGKRAKHPDWISEGSARDVVTRWKKAGWVQERQILALEPFWVWPTRRALATLGLPYRYRDIGQGSLDELMHLYAINEIRLHRADGVADWASERQILQGVVRTSGKDLLHRPDGEMHWKAGEITAIEVELLAKKPAELKENLMELIRGEGYLWLKEKYGKEKAVVMSQGERSQYREVWYFGPKSIRKHVRRARAELLRQGALSEEEADRLSILWYPLTKTTEEEELEKQEDEDDLDLIQNDNGDEEMNR
jgi:hypothetical protein